MYGDQIMAHPVGTGPFRLADWRRSSRIVLERIQITAKRSSTAMRPRRPTLREQVAPR